MVAGMTSESAIPEKLGKMLPSQPQFSNNYQLSQLDEVMGNICRKWQLSDPLGKNAVPGEREAFRSNRSWQRQLTPLSCRSLPIV